MKDRAAPQVDGPCGDTRGLHFNDGLAYAVAPSSQPNYTQTGGGF